MSLNIIIGKSKTGKSRYIYECIEEDLKNGKKPILFVPSQTRVLAEENYMKFLNKDGIIGLNITTISSYVENNIKSNNINFNDKYISKLDKKIILNQIISENKDIFKVFKNASSKDGFLDILNIYMDIFRKENVDIEKIEKLELTDKIIEIKLKEITYIYKKYLEKVKEKYMDNVDEIDIFVNDIISKKINFNDVNIYFDGYNNFTIGEYKIIECFMKNNANISISITTDISLKEDISSGNTQSIFEISNDTYLKILKLSNKVGISVNNKILYINHSKSKESLKYLSDNIFSNNNKKYTNKFEKDISLNITTNAYTEIDSVAKKISEDIRNGYKYDDFVIYTTNLDSYELLIKRIFYEYSIPVYIDKKHNITYSKLLIYIINLLNIASYGLNLDIALETLKLDLNDICKEDIYELENYILEFNISKYALKNEFSMNNYKNNGKIYDLEKINTTRKEILNIFDDISKMINKKLESNEIIEEVYNHLINKNVFNKYEESIKKEIVDDSIYNITNINLEEQVWSKIEEVFNSISKIYENDKIRIIDFLYIFKNTIKDINVKSIPPTMDKVSVVDINVSKLGMKKKIFFIGLNENNFPKKIDEDLFFSDFELEKLEENDIKFKENSLSKNNMQLYNIYEVLNNIEDELIIYIPASDFAGKAQRPSNFVTLLKQIFNISIKGDITKNSENKINIYDIYSKDKIFESMSQKIINKDIEELNNADDIKDLLILYEYLLKNKRYNTIINFKKDDENIDKDTVDLLYDKTLNSSVSKLELFKKCPFSYYMKYCLKINPRKDFEISSMDIGNFMHEVLEKFSIYLYTNNISWQAILKEGKILNEEFEDILLKIINEKLDSNLKKHKESLKYVILNQKLVNTMKKVITVIARGFNQSEFVPFGYEIEFKEGSLFSPIQIKLSEDRYMNLIGKIDRIDILKDEEKTYARVVDYKSSSKDLKLDDIKEGLSLQLITYMTSFIENMDKKEKIIFPAGMLYFNLSDKLLNLSEYIDDNEKIESECLKALQMKGIFLKDARVLSKMDNKFEDSSGKYIDISKQSIAKNSNKTLDQEEFELLCKEAKDIIKSIGNEIINGVVKIRPNKKADYCKYCEYSSVCRKDICV